MPRTGRLAVFVVVLAVLLSPARAQQPSLADIQSKLIGTWTVTFQVGGKPRAFVVSSVVPKSENSFAIDGSFNFVGDKEAPISDGEAVQSPDGMQVRFNTASGAAVTATLKPDGSFAGNSKFKAQDFPMAIAKGATAPPGPKFLNKAELEELVIGKTIRWRNNGNGNEITWQLESSGTLNGRNLSMNAQDGGAWSINETGQLCTRWSGRSANGCSHLVRLGGKLRLLTADKKPYGEVLEISK